MCFSSSDRIHVQQLVIIPTPTTILTNVSSPTYVPKGFDHQPLDEGQLGNSHEGSSPE
jgi:hypothetical protein